MLLKIKNTILAKQKPFFMEKCKQKVFNQPFAQIDGKSIKINLKFLGQCKQRMRTKIKCEHFSHEHLTMMLGFESFKNKKMLKILLSFSITLR